MGNLGSMLAEAYASWLQSLYHCCPAFGSQDEKSRPYGEKSAAFFKDQPGLVSPPSVEPHWPLDNGSERGQRAHGRLGSKGSHFSLGKRLLPAFPSRRPHISAPTDFRHVYSESFQFPAPQRRSRPLSFRPLQLSFYAPNSRLSPILPAFEFPEELATRSQPALVQAASTWDDNSLTLTHERSYSSMSFHLPRRPLNDGSSISGSLEATPPRIPERSAARPRPRAYTSPSVERMVERIASAMIEKERLQAEIDSVVERQSIYVSSRPSTAHGAHDLEPMPSIPALPAAAPSFAERLSLESRPRTAPPQTMQVSQRNNSAAEVHTTSGSLHKQTRDVLDRPLAPPLPLVLRPPLRKKKSFSRVSNWLFLATDHRRDISLDSVTNRPKPVTGREGFYQCVETPEARGRTSSDTVSSLSTWETEEGEQTNSTTWSPGSSPTKKQNTLAAQPGSVDGGAALAHGENDRHVRQSVGVAF